MSPRHCKPVLVPFVIINITAVELHRAVYASQFILLANQISLGTGETMKCKFRNYSTVTPELRTSTTSGDIIFFTDNSYRKYSINWT